jgi:hypothetical protein
MSDYRVNPEVSCRLSRTCNGLSVGMIRITREPAGSFDTRVSAECRRMFMANTPHKLYRLRLKRAHSNLSHIPAAHFFVLSPDSRRSLPPLPAAATFRLATSFSLAGTRLFFLLLTFVLFQIGACDGESHFFRRDTPALSGHRFRRRFRLFSPSSRRVPCRSSRPLSSDCFACG